MRWLILFSIIISFTFGCSPKTEKETAAPAVESTVISIDEAAGSIPCFKCHSYKNFRSAEKGKFSHAVHRDKGYHCNQCHISKPHHSIKTNTGVCNDCHNLKVITFKATAFPSKFNHESHAKLGCKECHPAIFDTKIGSQKITMEPIYQGRLCGACHDGKKAFASSDCAKCHEMKGFDKDLAYKVEAVGNAVFSHKFHTAMFSCNNCHPQIFGMKKTEGKMPMSEMEKGKTCGACHNGKAASALTDCMKCHKP
jgi:c(7)-type cytochrome triheme protein